MQKSTDTIRLNMLGLPVIQNLDDFSEIIHISKYTLFHLSQNSDWHYKIYDIQKKSGGSRTISQPSKNLKAVQVWILVNILNKLHVSNSCKGFEKGSSIYHNAEPHKNANTILTIDLEDFFPNIDQKKIFNIFRSIGYNNLISTVFSNICTYKQSLPQGSPCSPKLANLSTWNLDLRLQGYVGKRGINYTRYADDLSFSSTVPARIIKVESMIISIITSEGFRINEAKTRIAGNARAKIITGLIISNESIGIGQKKYKKLRSKIFHLTLPAQQSNLRLLNEVQGWIAYLNSVDVKRLNRAKKYIKDLKIKYPETLVNKV